MSLSAYSSEGLQEVAQDSAIPGARDLWPSVHIIIRRTNHYYPSIIRDINLASTTNNTDLV